MAIDYTDSPSKQVEPPKDYDEAVPNRKQQYTRSHSEPIKDYNVTPEPVANYGVFTEPPKDYEPPPDPPKDYKRSTEQTNEHVYSEIVKKQRHLVAQPYSLPPPRAPSWTEIFDSDRSSIGSRSSDGWPPYPPEFEAKPNRRSRSAQNRRMFQHPRLEEPKRNLEMRPLPRLSSLPGVSGSFTGSQDGIPPTPPASAGLVAPRGYLTSGDAFAAAPVRRIASQPLMPQRNRPTPHSDVTELLSVQTATKSLGDILPPRNYAQLFHDSSFPKGAFSPSKAGTSITGASDLSDVKDGLSVTVDSGADQRLSVDAAATSNDSSHNEIAISKEALDHFYTTNGSINDVDSANPKRILCFPPYIKCWMLITFTVCIVVIIVLVVVLPVTLV